jgi:hypothetical protein
MPRTASTAVGSRIEEHWDTDSPFRAKLDVASDAGTV